MKKSSFFIVFMCLVFSINAQQVEHVIVIGIDGMSPDGIANAKTPVMDELMKKGSFSMHARSVLPTSSSPNWASMIMGAGPEQHGITSNDWKPDNHKLPPITKTESGIFPTIYWLIKQNDPGSNIGAIYHWGDFGRLFEKSCVDKDLTYKNENKVADEAVKYIVDEKPKFLFVHIDHVDGAGHKFGHGSEKYYGAVSRADQLIGKIVEGIKKAGIYEKSAIIVSADHGGIGTGHGGESIEEMEIPIIISGAGIKKEYEITNPANIYDIASTVAYIFGYEQPKAWIGRPVISAFE